jgi:predicted enzyme related to lactoylglutathione lyase
MPSPLNFDGGLTISLKTKDRKKTAQWYQDVLGFKLLYDVAEIGWCELATEVARVNIGLADSEQVATGGAVPTFGVQDIDKARALMEKKDVRFDGKTQEIPGMVKLATFFDPDGNALMLYQHLGQH